MITWTPAAHDELRRHLDTIRAQLSGAGGVGTADVDANEVVDDLRRHVDEEFKSGGLHVVTVADVRRVLSRIGWPEAERRGEAAPAPVAPPPPPPPAPAPVIDDVGFRPPAYVMGRARKEDPSAVGTAGIAVFGVLTPVIAILLEAVNRMCADAVFDPFPTRWHLLLASVLPLANLALLARAEHVARHRRTYNLLNSFAIGVGIFYSLIFIPLVPVAIIAIVFLGLGFLPLSPLTGLIAAVKLRRRYLIVEPTVTADHRVLPPAYKPRLRGGLALAALALAALHVPPALTHVAMSWATSNDNATRARGLSVLRWVGNEEMMRRACYAQSGQFRGPLGEIMSFGSGVAPERAREAYYRVTGEPFNAKPPPDGTFGRRDWANSWDFEQGGDAVAGQVRGLSLTESRFDGIVDGDAAWAYGEWTMVFRNDFAAAREARAQVLLPPGGVVSRLTLWINGEPCEAAFGGREQVKTAYKSVVVRNRDPVLVTTAGPDRIMMQCFPVPADGGTMKIRFGVTFPLQLEKLDRATFGLPAIVERNFALKDKLAHSVWIESTTALADASGLLHAEHPKAALYALRGELAEVALSNLPAPLSVARDPNVRTVWSSAPAHVKNGAPIIQAIGESTSKPPGRLVIVVDASRGMCAHMSQVADALASIPAGIPFSVVIADEANDLPAPEPVIANGETTKAEAERVRRIACRGGQDAVPALCRAWDRAAEVPDSTILWIHGPQPVLLDNVESLQQRYERRPDGPRLIMLQAVAGPNRVCEALGRQGDISRLPRQLSPGDDLRRLFYSWSSNQPTLTATRTRATTQPTEAGVKETAPHLARLWASEEVQKASAAGRAAPGSGTAKSLMKLASDYQLVTPLTGAVVLETQAQYAANGLTPVDPDSVPTVPEPETIALVIVAGVAIAWTIYRRRARARAAA